MRVGLFVPCFIDSFYPQVGIATVRVLERLGMQVSYPPEQTCCGQPHFNAGHWVEATALAQRFCHIFEPYEAVVSPSGSCAAMVRNHYEQLVGPQPVSSRVFELCEWLDRYGVRDCGATLPGRAVLHIGCHARRELHAADAVVRLMQAVKGLQIVPVESDEWCCGFGGTFSVKFPELSVAMGRRKLQPILDRDVDYVISTDSSCLMHLAGLLSRMNRTRPRLLHVAEVLASEKSA